MQKTIEIGEFDFHNVEAWKVSKARDAEGAWVERWLVEALYKFPDPVMGNEATRLMFSVELPTVEEIENGVRQALHRAGWV